MLDQAVMGKSFDEIAVGDAVTEIALPISYTKISGIVAATRDWFPGHHNPGYAQAQGRETIYANTMFFQAFLSRVALGWAGAAWFEQRRTLKMIKSVYPDDLLIGSGVVKSKSVDADGVQKIVLDMIGKTDGDVAISGELTLALPTHSQGLIENARQSAAAGAARS
ncbi:MAG: hypothetical protein EOP62_04650 [Sphingomonadales bacterium]|nr:MAG: hypothetical protein EOP62_04650 [Sphingomonadales bacterium]